MTYRRDLWEIAAQQHGIVTTAEAAEAGVPAVELRKLAGRRALERRAQGVYRHVDVPLDQFTELAAAVAIAGRDGYLYGDAVLGLFDLAQVNPPQIEVATPHRWRGTAPPDVAVQSGRRVDAADLTQYKGIPATTVRRALLDAIGRIDDSRIERATRDARRRELIDERDVQEIRGALTKQSRAARVARQHHGVAR